MKQSQVYEFKDKLFLTLNANQRGGIILGLVIGVASFLGGMGAGEYGRTWGAFLLNLMFFFSISLGGVAFGNMQDIIGALWARPIKRLHESFGAFMPCAFVGFLIFLLAVSQGFLHADEVYPWISSPQLLHSFPGKNQWLQPSWMIGRDIAALVIIMSLSAWHFKLTIKPDLALLAGDKDEAFREGEFSREKLRFFSAPVLVVYSLCFTLLVFDLTGHSLSL